MHAFDNVTQKRKFVFIDLLIWVNVPKPSRAIPARKCFIKPPAK